MVPDGLDPSEEARLVDDLASRIKSKATSAQVDLDQRARALASQYQLPVPSRVEWSSRQMTRWGSCTPDSGRIRISERLASMPPWVLDSVLVHEMAHLVVADHGPEFEALVSQYELSERAKGYLMAIGEGRAV